MTSFPNIYHLQPSWLVLEQCARKPPVQRGHFCWSNFCHISDPGPRPKNSCCGKSRSHFFYFFSPANCKRLLLLLLSLKVDNHLSSQAHTDYQLMIDTLKKVKVNANYAQTDFKMLQQGKTVQACCNRKCLSADDVLP